MKNATVTLGLDYVPDGSDQMRGMSSSTRFSLDLNLLHLGWAEVNSWTEYSLYCPIASSIRVHANFTCN